MAKPFYLGPDCPSWKIGFPCRREERTVKYGLFAEIVERNDYAWFSIYSSKKDYLWNSEAEPLVSTSFPEVFSWKGWDKRRSMMNAALKKALEKARAMKSVKQANDPEFAKLYPVVHDMMTSLEGEKKGEHREGNSMWIVTGDGRWTVCFAERNEDATLWTSADTFWGLFEALEKAVTSENPDWRVKSDNGSFSRKKKDKRRG